MPLDLVCARPVWAVDHFSDVPDGFNFSGEGFPDLSHVGKSSRVLVDKFSYNLTRGLIHNQNHRAYNLKYLKLNIFPPLLGTFPKWCLTEAVLCTEQYDTNEFHLPTGPTNSSTFLFFIY